MLSHYERNRGLITFDVAVADNNGVRGETGASHSQYETFVQPSTRNRRDLTGSRATASFSYLKDSNP